MNDSGFLLASKDLIKLGNGTTYWRSESYVSGISSTLFLLHIWHDLFYKVCQQPNTGFCQTNACQKKEVFSVCQQQLFLESVRDIQQEESLIVIAISRS